MIKHFNFCKAHLARPEITAPGALIDECHIDNKDLLHKHGFHCAAGHYCYNLSTKFPLIPVDVKPNYEVDDSGERTIHRFTVIKPIYIHKETKV